MKNIKYFESWKNMFDSIGNYIIFFRTKENTKLQKEIVNNSYRRDAIKYVINKFPSCKIQSIKKINDG